MALAKGGLPDRQEGPAVAALLAKPAGVAPETGFLMPAWRGKGPDWRLSGADGRIFGKNRGKTVAISSSPGGPVREPQPAPCAAQNRLRSRW